MSEAIDPRIVDLEIRFMGQEKMLQDLSDVLVAHQKIIDRLEADVAALRERTPEESEPIGDERPPHY